MRVDVFYFNEDFVAEGGGRREGFALCCRRREEEGSPDFVHDFYHHVLLGGTGVDFEADDDGKVTKVRRIRTGR